jgi:hypothetical protein
VPPAKKGAKSKNAIRNEFRVNTLSKFYEKFHAPSKFREGAAVSGGRLQVYLYIVDGVPTAVGGSREARKPPGSRREVS